MRIYSTIKNTDDLLRQCNFSENEIAFIKKNGTTKKDLTRLATFTDATDLLQGAVSGGFTGALTSAMASSREERKKAIKKGLLLGALGGAAGSVLSPLPIDSLNGAIGGGLAGYLAALHQESI